MSAGLARRGANWSESFSCLGALRRRFAIPLGLGIAMMCGVPAADAALAQDPGGMSSLDASDTRTPPPEGSTEIISARSRTSNSYARPDGTVVTRYYGGSVNFADHDGAFKPIDNALRRSGNVVRNGDNSYELSLPTQLGDAGIRFAHDGASVTLWPEGASGTAIIDGASAKYPDAWPATTLSYTTVGDAVKEDLVLRDNTAPRSFRFGIRLSAELDLAPSETGGFSIIDSQDQPVMQLPAPVMYDAAGLRNAVDARIAKTTDGFELTLTPDRTWLADRERQWPVTIDPQISVASTQDCAVYRDSATTSFCGDTVLSVGRYPAVAGKQTSSLLRFDTAAALPPAQTIESATLNLYPLQMNESELEVQVAPLDVDWDGNVSWNNRNGTDAWTTPGGDAGQAVDSHRFYAPGSDWIPWDVTAMVSDWAAERRANRGMLLQSTDFSTLSTLFASAEDGPATAPYIEIVHHPRLGSNSTYRYRPFYLADGSALRVNLGNGNLLLTSSDVFSLHHQTPTALDRVHNSLDSSPGAFGPGTRLSVGQDVKLPACGRRNNRCLIAPDGARWTFLRQDDGSFVAPADFAAVLEQRLDGTFTLLFESTGVRMNFSSGSDPRLLSISDPGENQHTFTYGGVGSTLTKVEDENGNEIDVHTNVLGLIDEIDSPTLGTWTYGYTAGRLTSVTSPTATTSYGYDISGRLSTIDDGTSDWTISYDGSGRVSSITQTSTTTSSISFSYAAPSSPCTGPSTVRATVTTTTSSSVTCLAADLRPTYETPIEVQDAPHTPGYENEPDAADPDDGTLDPTPASTCTPDLELGDWDYCDQTDDPPGFSTLSALAEGRNPDLEPGGAGWGISEPRANMFGHSFFDSLAPKHARIIVGWDTAWVATRPGPNQANASERITAMQQYIAAATAKNIDVLVTLQHSDYDQTKLPSRLEYRLAFFEYLKLLPTRYWTPWNEPNTEGQPTSYDATYRRNEFSGDGPVRAAQFYKTMKSACAVVRRACLVLAGDFVDSTNLTTSSGPKDGNGDPILDGNGDPLKFNGSRSYYRAYVEALKDSQPKHWAIHPYKAGQYIPSRPGRRTPWRSFIDRSDNFSPNSRIWVTEYGQRAFENDPPEALYSDDKDGQTGRARNLRVMLDELEYSNRISRFYYYRYFDWNDLGNGNGSRDKWASGLIDPGPAFNGVGQQPRCLFFIYRHMTNPSNNTPATPVGCPSGPYPDDDDVEPTP